MKETLHKTVKIRAENTLQRNINSHVTPTRGLQQGGPISPYLFILVVKAFSGLITKVLKEGVIHVREGHKILHLFFADDGLLFVRSNQEECLKLVEVVCDLGISTSSVRLYLQSKLDFKGKYFLKEGILEYPWGIFKLVLKIYLGSKGFVEGRFNLESRVKKTHTQGSADLVMAPRCISPTYGLCKVDADAFFSL
ncbi:hypothetical protein Cgig2_023756 [Carnegiea gigantea]|uniref:Reverse transcriptase domain-containing protein n=1 Tax=Carnegiea gigantea TaxID=171969 RepID=A0A9Q1KEX9_9CARY|nr:hypothetical protein Cgig2_023756 [Carnegiea gigantea]